MANPEHLKIVDGCAEAIRKWREENPDVRLDLSGADLRAAHSAVQISVRQTLAMQTSVPWT